MTARFQTIPSDTSHESFRVQIAAMKRLGLAGRVRLTLELCEGLRRTLQDGVRFRHPDYDERAVRLAATRLAIGDELFRLAYPGVDVAP
jgi:hypothetical protein